VLDDASRNQRPAIRAMFSVSQISQQLDHFIAIDEVAHSIAEVEMALRKQ